MAAAPQAASRRISTVVEPRPPARSSSSSYIVGSGPHYATTRRHSLYGTEDRIIIDPGSKYWKVGFSGEGKPRQVYKVVQAEDEPTLWSWQSSKTPEEYEEADRMLSARLQDALRAVFFESLMTDPKSRKVIIVEHPLLPLRVKDLMARILFDNLNIPSLSFASCHMLALLTAGRTTGLVVDCGHLETTVLPISSSRPMYPMLRTTPRAGARLTIHLRSLILEYGTYHPPFASLAGSVNSAPRPSRVPPEILTDALIEDIKSSCCFVGQPFELTVFPESALGPREDRMDVDVETPSRGQSLHASPPPGQRSGTQSGAHSGAHTPSRPPQSSQDFWASQYERSSTATDFMVPVSPPPPIFGTGRGSIRIPGWVRERAAEYLFLGGDVDEPSVAEVVLQSLLKVPVDLRKKMVSNILVIGGTPMLPGFIPRLHQEMVRTLTKPTPAPSVRSPKRRAYDPFDSVRPLALHVAIINNPSPPPSTSVNSQNAGRAPAFSPSSMAWVGGSLAGVLKTGGEEILHDKWDEATVEEPETPVQDVVTKGASLVLPDWTRVPMVVGAPHAGKHAPRQFGLRIQEPMSV